MQMDKNVTKCIILWHLLVTVGPVSEVLCHKLMPEVAGNLFGEMIEQASMLNPVN